MKSKLSIKEKKEPKKCILTSRIENATQIELERICDFLGLQLYSSSTEIISEYKSAAGNSFVNVARKVGIVDDVTYRQILIDVVEKIRPLNTDIKEYSEKLSSFLTSIIGTNTNKDVPLSITDLEISILKITQSKIENQRNSHSTTDKMNSNINGISKSGLTSVQKVMGSSAISVGIGASSAIASRGALLFVGGTVASTVGAVLIPVALSTPAYRKTINVTIEIIMVGLRQSAEMELL